MLFDTNLIRSSSTHFSSLVHAFFAYLLLSFYMLFIAKETVSQRTLCVTALLTSLYSSLLSSSFFVWIVWNDQQETIRYSNRLLFQTRNSKNRLEFGHRFRNGCLCGIDGLEEFPVELRDSCHPILVCVDSM